MPAWLLVLLAFGATARLTRLISKDRLALPLRDAIVARWAKKSTSATPTGLAYFIECPWCLSVWIGLLVGALVVAFPSNRPLVALWIGLSASLVAARLQSTEDD